MTLQEKIENPKVNNVVVPICEPCQKGEKGSCNVPECIFCRMEERPLMLDIYATVEWHNQVDRSRVLDKLKDSINMIEVSPKTHFLDFEKFVYRAIEELKLKETS